MSDIEDHCMMLYSSLVCREFENGYIALYSLSVLYLYRTVHMSKPVDKNVLIIILWSLCTYNISHVH